MTPRQQAFKTIEGKIEAIQNLSIECIDYIYLAAHNEAIEMVAKYLNSMGEEARISEYVRNLKVESTDQIGLKK